MTKLHWAEAPIRRPSPRRMADLATDNGHTNGHTPGRLRLSSVVLRRPIYDGSAE